MQDLSGQFPAPLVPSSMSSGGEVYSSALAMTAPGSRPISAPVPTDPGQEHAALPLPIDSNAGTFPVSHPGLRPKASAHEMQASGAGRFNDTHGVPAASLWTETA